MKKFEDYYKFIDDFYNKSSTFIRLTIFALSFMISNLIKKFLFGDLGEIFSFILGFLSFLALLPLFSYLFLKIKGLKKKR